MEKEEKTSSFLKYCHKPDKSLGKEMCTTGFQAWLKDITAATNIVLIRGTNLGKQRLNHRAGLLFQP